MHGAEDRDERERRKSDCLSCTLLLYGTEYGKMLNDLDIDCQMPEDMMEKRLRAVEEKEKIELDPLQHKAVIESIKHGLLILTGGPGTGKTTTINTMIQFSRARD